MTEMSTGCLNVQSAAHSLLSGILFLFCASLLPLLPIYKGISTVLLESKASSRVSPLFGRVTLLVKSVSRKDHNS